LSPTSTQAPGTKPDPYWTKNVEMWVDNNLRPNIKYSNRIADMHKIHIPFINYCGNLMFF